MASAMEVRILGPDGPPSGVDLYTEVDHTS